MADLYERLKRFQQNTTRGDSAEPGASASNPPPLLAALSTIPGVTRARDLIGQAEKREREKERFLSSIGVERAENECGAFGLREAVYPLCDMPYPPKDIAGSELALLFRDSGMSELAAGDILFLDTETTGLAGGTGTVPFLTGLGFFDGDAFRVRQFLMRDYDEEPAVLLEIQRLLERFPAIATYNGKGFDVPILNARFLLNRFRTQISEMPHADFLYPARRFWKDLLPNCTLLCVEEYLTGRRREGDIPGEQIPYVYFDFLRGLRLPRMQPVLQHNAEDVRTLATIASRVCRLLRLPLPSRRHGLELAAVGRCYAACEDWERTVWYFEKAVEDLDAIPEISLTLQKQLSVIYKRMTRFSDACRLWDQMAEEWGDLYALVELAKHFEHREKDYRRAFFYTEKALAVVRQTSWNANTASTSEFTLEALQHRRERLSRKEK